MDCGIEWYIEFGERFVLKAESELWALVDVVVEVQEQSDGHQSTNNWFSDSPPEMQ